MTYKTTLSRDKDIEVVEYEISRGCRGIRDSIGGKRGCGPLITPNEEPEIEITSIIDVETNQGIDLTDSEEDGLIEKLWSIQQDDEPEYEYGEED